MRRLICFFLFCAAVLTAEHCYAQWITQNSGTTEHLLDISMISKDTGWVCGENGTILHTTNTGINWLPQVSGITDRIETIFFTNSFTCFAATRVSGKIIKTSNGGLNWNLIFQTNTASFNSIFFLDSLHGWIAAVGLPNDLYKTTNGGLTWDSINVSTGIGNHVSFIDQNTGWFSQGGAIYSSTNSGFNWTLLFSTIGFGEIAEFSFLNAKTGWLVTLETYRVYKTTNGGINWNFLDTLDDCFNAHSITFTSENIGWVAGDCGYLFSTSDGGSNWFRQNSNTNSFLNEVHFADDSTGWVVGGAGTILYTNNGGAILGINTNQNEIPTRFELFQNYPNPFNPTTSIGFRTPENGSVKLKVYDALGREITILINEELSPGEYNVSWDAVNYPSGVYFYKLESKNYFITKKMLLIK